MENQLPEFHLNDLEEMYTIKTKVYRQNLKRYVNCYKYEAKYESSEPSLRLSAYFPAPTGRWCTVVVCFNFFFNFGIFGTYLNETCGTNSPE